MRTVATDIAGNTGTYRNVIQQLTYHSDLITTTYPDRKKTSSLSFTRKAIRQNQAFRTMNERRNYQPLHKMLTHLMTHTIRSRRKWSVLHQSTKMLLTATGC